MNKQKENKIPNIRGKGIPISPQIRESVLYCHQRLKSNGKKNKEIVSIIRQVTKIGRTSVFRILRDGSVNPKTRKVKGPKYQINDEDIKQIDEIICNIFEEIKIPSKIDVYNKIKSNIENSISFKKCGGTTFFNLLKNAGYKTNLSVKATRKLKIQEPIIRKKRTYYLKMKRELENNYEFIYLDETYIHKNYLKTRILLLLNHSKRVRIKLQITKGHRFSVLYAGGMNGFIRGSLMVRMNSEINSEIFEEWLREQLLPKLEEPSVIVFDNASTHSRILNRRPNSNSRKDDIKEWLTVNGINFDEKLNKKQLYAKVLAIEHRKEYVVDQIIRSAGHIPLRTPLYCCELNPIEKIWAEWKRRTGSQNLNYSTQEFLYLIENVFNDINTEYWRKCFRNLIKIEYKFSLEDQIN